VRQLVGHIAIGIVLAASAGAVFSATEAEKIEMQKRLNAEVLSKPFFAEEPEKVEAYIQEASKRKLKPPEYTGANWREGYTCRDLLRYSWHEYRDCAYYHRYYGRYYILR
jgi:hypothetical protein